MVQLKFNSNLLSDMFSLLQSLKDNTSDKKGKRLVQ